MLVRALMCGATAPSIPDQLLVARGAGDVIFFCDAGVLQRMQNCGVESSGPR